ncbi:hypothetical protein NMY22_g15397 [Coprinellus aureogranulatus]|nr:hypothetical protein NMY22_g15397 [Coprinellus aureogranulatus]
MSPIFRLHPQWVYAIDRQHPALNAHYRRLHAQSRAIEDGLCRNLDQRSDVGYLCPDRTWPQDQEGRVH